MLILWIRKNKTNERTGQQKNNKDAFKKHDEAMKKFSFSHPKIEVGNSQDITTADGLVLAPVQCIKLSKHIQN